MEVAAQRICAPATPTSRVPIVPFVSCFFSLLVFAQSTRSLITISLLILRQLFSNETGTCPFGRSHVDIPLGDLDADNQLSGYNVLKIEGSPAFPFGTSESYPLMTDTADNVLTNTAHRYSECSNKGLCDRIHGECECLPGYEGSSCQRASCPSKTVTKISNKETQEMSKFINQRGILGGATGVFNGKATTNVPQDSCSGHGTCMTIEGLASNDYDNIYNLWDRESTMGCKCDPG